LKRAEDARVAFKSCLHYSGKRRSFSLQDADNFLVGMGLGFDSPKSTLGPIGDFPYNTGRNLVARKAFILLLDLLSDCKGTR